MGYNLPANVNPDGTLKDLRSRTIERLKTEGLFNMRYWCPEEYESDEYTLHHRKRVNVCSTASCLAGNIVMAAIDIGLESAPPRVSWDWEDAARDLWEEQYGPEEAGSLDFFGDFSTRGIDCLPEEAVAHLEAIRNG